MRASGAPALVLVTANYPYLHRGGEISFVAPEVPQLVREFGRLRVVPLHAGGPRVSTPAGVEVDTTLAAALRRQLPLASVRAPAAAGVPAEMWRAWRVGGWLGLLRTWRWAAIADVTERWACAQAEGSASLYYTYWRGGATLGLLRLAAKRPGTRVVSRVHRHDLYEEAFDPPFQPWHPRMYGQLALTVAVAEHGRDYLLRAGVDPRRVIVARLGTEAARRRCAASADGVLRIVSCSYASPVKRVPLIARVLIELARREPAQRFVWTHFGGGSEQADVERCGRSAPANLRVDLRGQVAPADVMAHYAAEPVDLFVQLSASEGLPVSIQEAAGAGIPVLSTAVGGVTEIVGRDNGATVPVDASIGEIADAMQRLLRLPEHERAAMRDRSAARWAEGFDAERNHAAFAALLARCAAGLPPVG